MGVGVTIMVGCIGAAVVFGIWRLCIKLAKEDERRREDEKNE